MGTERRMRRLMGAAVTVALGLGCGCMMPEPAGEAPDRAMMTPADRATADLLAQAQAEFARGRYGRTATIAERVLELDPNNLPAWELGRRAREELRREAWRATAEADARARANERAAVRAASAFPSATVQYPDRESWQQIQARNAP